MKLVKLECPNCNAKFDVNEEMKQFTCNYCGTTTVIDDEAITVNNVSSKLKNLIEDIKDYYDNGNYKKVVELTEENIDDYPKNKDISKYYIDAKINLIEEEQDISIAYADCYMLYVTFMDNKKVKSFYKKIGFKFYDAFLNSFDVNNRMLHLINLSTLIDFKKIDPKDKKINKIYNDMRDKIKDTLKACIEENDFKNNIYPQPTNVAMSINETFPDDKELEELCDKYKEVYEPYSVDGLLDEIKGKLNEGTKNEKFYMTLFLIDIPLIILLPLIMMGFILEEYGLLAFAIIPFIVLIYGLSLRGNSCELCGKFNGYRVIDKKILDTWVTTESRSVYDNQTKSYKNENVVVTKEKVEFKKECVNCGHITYVTMTINK